MRIIVAGTPEVALPPAEAIRASSHEIIAVLTRPDAVSGRGRKVSRSPLGQWADGHGIPVYQPARPGDPEFLEQLEQLAPDCVAVIAYGALVPQRALDIPRLGWINLHFSVLPAWRGAAPAQRALMAGDEVTGASVFQLEKGLDTGPVYGVMTQTIRPRDTAGDLLDKLAEGGSGLMVAVLDGLEAGEMEARPQPEEGVSLAPKITVEEARVDWTQNAVTIDRRVRGCTPAPGAWTTFRGARLGLGPVEPLSEEAEPLAPGELRVLKKAVHVGTATGAVALGEVRPAGKKAMAAVDWARGARPSAGERFETEDEAGLAPSAGAASEGAS
ncbi:methionyl-tRNA formyltransferase [Kineosporia rhizophila]|uniref:methionyl-tRNA formyltransferase n=1 Tax=Kineosporia TaxID=49184 RepID=UPI001E48F400|nr:MULTISPECIES: methionyl-tRNA formyltransferase [Kineosporia]MCE0540574.1 methionyl-tRNA formyltransferase [Kineosporia rhizophila]GLY17295.1 methionyl-tRNA formyltransferase [Kineosporia sp. NBRC 101677]